LTTVILAAQANVDGGSAVLRGVDYGVAPECQTRDVDQSKEVTMTSAADRFDVPLYSVAEAARYLGVPTSTFASWAHGYVRRPPPGRREVTGDAIVTVLPSQSKGDASAAALSHGVHRRWRGELMVYLLGLAAAVLLAVGFVLQQHAAEQEPPSLRLSPWLLVDLARRPRWLSGIASMVGGQVLGAVSFNFGAVALVEPLLAANVLFALPLSCLYHRRRMRVIDVVGGLVLVAGLAVFVLASQPGGGSPHNKTKKARSWPAPAG